MSGSRRVARLAFYWALIGCGIAPAAAAQETAVPEPPSKTQIAAPSTVTPSRPVWLYQSRQPAAPAASQRSVSPWLPQPFQSADPVYKAKLSDQHVIVVSTLTLILVGIIVVLLAT